MLPSSQVSGNGPSAKLTVCVTLSRASYRIERNNLGALAGIVQKSVRVRFNFGFSQGLFYFYASFFQRRDDLSRGTCLEAGHIAVFVVISDLFLGNHNKVAETEIEILFNPDALL